MVKIEPTCRNIKNMPNGGNWTVHGVTVVIVAVVFLIRIAADKQALMGFEMNK